MKACNTCGLERPAERFRGNRAKCRNCEGQAVKDAYAAMTPEERTKRNRRATLQKMYKMTLETFEAMAINGCMSCGSFDNLVVDHDHACCATEKTCGKCVRGVLCSPCNWAEGLLNSDPNRALALATYMLRSQNVLVFENTNEGEDV